MPVKITAAATSAAIPLGLSGAAFAETAADAKTDAVLEDTKDMVHGD